MPKHVQEKLAKKSNTKAKKIPEGKRAEAAKSSKTTLTMRTAAGSKKRK